LASKHRTTEFERAWQGVPKLSIEDYLAKVPESAQPALLRELLHIELVCRREGGESPRLEQYGEHFPDHVRLLASIFADHSTADSGKQEGGAALPAQVRPRH
jgi:hypothetical protein